MSEPARVLIADDEESIRFFLRETLEEAGHEVLEVANGDDAAEALAGGGAFFLAFLDIRMPGAVRARPARRGAHTRPAATSRSS